MWHRVSMWAITLAVDQGRLTWLQEPGRGGRQVLRSRRTGAIYDYKLVRRGSATPNKPSGWLIRRRPRELLELAA